MISFSSEVNGPHSALTEGESAREDMQALQPSQGAPHPLFNHGCGPVVSDVYKREVWSYFYLFCGLHGCLTGAHVGSGYRQEEVK